MTQPFVAVLMGSDSDLPTMQSTLDTLTGLGVAWEVKITSAHRTPAQTMDYVRAAEARGCRVFIAAAGLAAHLAGVVAAHTLRPVIGVPMEGGPLNGFDALLSTVQMPGGIPVASVAIGKAGARNAAYLAAQVLAVADEGLFQRLQQERSATAQQVIAKDDALQDKLQGS
jgi:5-(carboxyamino)imidazole ribonucleotide mutase